MSGAKLPLVEDFVREEIQRNPQVGALDLFQQLEKLGKKVSYFYVENTCSKVRRDLGMQPLPYKKRTKDHPGRKDGNVQKIRRFYNMFKTPYQKEPEKHLRDMYRILDKNSHINRAEGKDKIERLKWEAMLTINDFCALKVYNSHIIRRFWVFFAQLDIIP